MQRNLVQQTFVREHINDDVRDLALKAARYPDVDMADALVQIKGYQAIKQKVPAWYACEALQFPPTLSLEQSSSEATARYKAALLDAFLPMESRKKGVDLTGGLGVDAYFLSETFEEYVYVERQALLCELAAHNFSQLGREQISVQCAEAEEYLRSMQPVDFIFIDPARRDDKGKKVFALQDCTPDVSALFSSLREKCRLLMIKLSPMLDISLALKQLGDVAACHVLALDNDCKELLLCVGQAEANAEAAASPATQLVACNLRKQGDVHTFRFTREEENAAPCRLAAAPAQYLYEPDVTLLKAGAYKLLTQVFPLQKLHVNTHLYTSESLQKDFPGRVFNIVEVLSPSAKETKKRLQGLQQMNVATRNYPESVETIRKKYRIKEGGQLYLFAATLADNQRVLLLCEKAER
ncbi:MAG: SAM-dependent methyltransferase [Bacteroidales bacterium]|nr:SAM-dependent methyltransferase [Bacteroidales bacterium]